MFKTEAIDNDSTEVAFIGSLGVAIYNTQNESKVRHYDLDDDLFIDQDDLYSHYYQLCINKSETIIKTKDARQESIDEELKLLSLKMHALDFLCKASTPYYSEELILELYQASIELQEKSPEVQNFVINRLLSLPQSLSGINFTTLLEKLDKANHLQEKSPIDTKLRSVLRIVNLPESNQAIEKIRVPFVNFIKNFTLLGEFEQEDITFMELERELTDEGRLADIVKSILSFDTEESETLDAIIKRTLDALKFKVLERESQLANRNALTGIIDNFETSLNNVIHEFKAEVDDNQTIQKQKDITENNEDNHTLPLSNAIISTWLEDKKTFEIDPKRTAKVYSENPTEAANQQVDYLFDLYTKKKTINKIDNELCQFIEKNLKNGYSVHLCKTLCNLAGQLLTLNDHSVFAIILDLYRMAQKTNDNDAVAFNGYAETLKAMGRLDEALETYQQAKDRFNDNTVAFNGYAETLKIMGRLDEALEAYQQAKDRFNDNTVAFNGYAETLKAMGRLDEALKAYQQETTEEFNNDAVAACGYAETLKAMGRLDEALKAYQQAKDRFNDNTVAFNGYAETLKAMGRLDEALEAYQQAKDRFNDNTVAFNGYAETLKAMGRLDEALEAYQQAEERFNNDAVAVCGYAETLKAMGRLDEALKAYQQAKNRFNDDAVAVCGYAETLKAMGRLDEALEAYQHAKDRFNDNAVAVCGYAETLKAMGRNKEALNTYKIIYKKFPYDRVIRFAFAKTYIITKQYDQALTLIETPNKLTDEQDWRDFYLKISILLWQNKVKEALEALSINQPSNCPYHKSKAYLNHIYSLALFRDDQIKASQRLCEKIDHNASPTISASTKLIIHQIDWRLEGNILPKQSAKKLVDYISKDGDGKKFNDLAEQMDSYYLENNKDKKSKENMIMIENQLLLDLPELYIPIKTDGANQYIQ